MPAKFCDFGELYLYEFCQILPDGVAMGLMLWLLQERGG